MVMTLRDHTWLQPVVHPPLLERALVAQHLLPAALRRCTRLRLRLRLRPNKALRTPGLPPSSRV